jgi:hypothetical protein
MAQHCLCFAPHSIAPLCFIRKRANPSPAKPSAQKGLQAYAYCHTAQKQQEEQKHNPSVLPHTYHLKFFNRFAVSCSLYSAFCPGHFLFYKK